MQSSNTVWLKRSAWAIVILLGSLSVAADAVPNVAGTWIASASNGLRRATQTITFEQDGAKLTGTFRGPRQSGTVEGTVTGNTVKFHVTATTPLDYTGTIDGDDMKGTLTGDGKTGEWTASRVK